MVCVIQRPQKSPTFAPMPSIRPSAKGYRVQVEVKGQRDSKTFATKREAQQWAAAREIELRAQAAGTTTSTLADAFRRYAEDVSPKRRGWRWEHTRLTAFERTILPCKLRIGAITPEHIALWRDARLAQVSPGTVLRETALLSAVFEVARREWRWLDSNPVKLIRKPPKPAHRERVITWREIKLMLRALDHHPRSPAKSVTQSIALCFLAALRTGMRAGELSGLAWDKYHGHYARLDRTKTGVARDVPLSSKARRVFERARRFDPVLCFGVSPQTLDTLFRRARDRAGIMPLCRKGFAHPPAVFAGH